MHSYDFEPHVLSWCYIHFISLTQGRKFFNDNYCMLSCSLFSGTLHGYLAYIFLCHRLLYLHPLVISGKKIRHYVNKTSFFYDKNKTSIFMKVKLQIILHTSIRIYKALQ